MSSNEAAFASSRELKPEELDDVSGGWVSTENGLDDIGPGKFCSAFETRPGTYLVSCPRGFGPHGF
jgi:hypothetical protein